MQKPVLPHLPSALHLDSLTRQQGSAVAVAVLVAGGLAWYALTRKKVPPEEIEQARRTLLVKSGRTTVGTIIGIDEYTEDSSSDGMLELPAGDDRQVPHLLIYRYRHAGVTYECAQDVSLLPDYVRNLRIDLPVQVRYDPGNPGDSIVIAETWTGLQQEPPVTATLVHESERRT